MRWCPECKKNGKKTELVEHILMATFYKECPKCKYYKVTISRGARRLTAKEKREMEEQ